MARLRLLLGVTCLACGAAAGILDCDGGSGTPDGGDASENDSSSSDAKPDVKFTPDAGQDADASVPTARAFAMSNLVTVDSAVRFCFLASASGAPTWADGVGDKPVPSGQPLAAGTVSQVTLPNALVGSYVRIVVYYEDSLTAFGLSNATCTKLASLSLEGDAGAAGDSGVNLIQYVDFDVSDEVIPPGVIKTSSTYLLYASGCTHRQDSAHAYSYCNNDQFFGPTPYTDFYAWLVELDTTSAAPPANQSRVQAVLGDDIWRMSGLLNDQSVGVSYGDASTSWINGPDIVDDSGVGKFPYVDASKPAYGGTLVPSLANATNEFFVAPGFPATIVQTSDLLALSGLTPSDLSTGTTFTLIPMGNGIDEKATTADGGLNPRFLGIRIIRNK